MIPGPDAQRIRGQLIVLWTIWAASLSGLLLIYLSLVGGKPLPTTARVEETIINLIGLAPLFVSIVIRWLVLPRASGWGRVLVLLVAGVGLSEACGFLGIFLGGPYRDSLFVLGILGITQYVPLYARRLLEPRSPGFIPNN